MATNEELIHPADHGYCRCGHVHEGACCALGCRCNEPALTRSNMHTAECGAPNEEITVLCRKCNAPTDPDDSGLCLGCDQDYPAFCAGCGEPYHASELGIDSHRCRHCRTGR